LGTFDTPEVPSPAIKADSATHGSQIAALPIKIGGGSTDTDRDGTCALGETP
jgi:hypothetical protein